jgi:hypothetical protein
MKKVAYMHQRINTLQVWIIKRYKRTRKSPNSQIDKEKAIIADGLSFLAPLFNESCSLKSQIAISSLGRLS